MVPNIGSEYWNGISTVRAAPAERKYAPGAASTAMNQLTRSSTWLGSAADEAHLDLAQARGLGRAHLRVAIGPRAPGGGEPFNDLRVARLTPDERPQIQTLGGEEARVERAVGGEPGPRAVRAEGLRDRGDDADLAASVLVAVPRRDLAAVARPDWLERKLAVDRRDDLSRGDDVVESPTVRRADVHELDEAEGHARSFEVARHREDARLVHAALGHHVDLDRREPGGLRRLDAREDLGDWEIDVVHGLERRVIERVEADRDPAEPGSREGLGLLRQQGTVRGQREIEVSEPRELLHEPLEVPSHEGLAARETNLPYAQPDEDPDEPLDLLERQDLGARQELEVFAEDLLRHAVDTAKVASVGDRNSQVVQGTAERVERVHTKSMRPRAIPSGAPQLSRARTARLTASCSGNPPSRDIEWTSSPSTETSNVPPSHGMSSIEPSRWPNSSMSERARSRVWGSYPHSAQYVIFTLCAVAVTWVRGGYAATRLTSSRISRITSAFAKGVVSSRTFWSSVERRARTSSGSWSTGASGAPNSGCARKISARRFARSAVTEAGRSIQWPISR